MNWFIQNLTGENIIIIYEKETTFLKMLRSPKKDRNDFKPEYIEFDFLFFVLLLKISRGKRSIEAKIIVK